MERGRTRREEKKGRGRPGESEVTVFIKAPGLLHCSFGGRGGSFNRVLNSRNQTLDEEDKKRHSGIPPPRRHLTFLMTFESA